jgi:hypothetical protein
MADTQNYANHARRTPLYYNAAALVLAANILWAGYRLITSVSIDNLMALLVGIVLLVMAVAARTQTLTVQNRVIRLEQRLRFRELLRPEVAVRAASLPIAQIVALRFACDAELPGLVEEVLAGRLSEPKAIKQKVQDWQGDFLRA